MKAKGYVNLVALVTDNGSSVVRVFNINKSVYENDFKIISEMVYEDKQWKQKPEDISASYRSEDILSKNCWYYITPETTALIKSKVEEFDIKKTVYSKVKRVVYHNPIRNLYAVTSVDDKDVIEDMAKITHTVYEYPVYRNAKGVYEIKLDNCWENWTDIQIKQWDVVDAPYDMIIAHILDDYIINYVVKYTHDITSAIPVELSIVEGSDNIERYIKRGNQWFTFETTQEEVKKRFSKWKECHDYILSLENRCIVYKFTTNSFKI